MKMANKRKSKQTIRKSDVLILLEILEEFKMLSGTYFFIYLTEKMFLVAWSLKIRIWNMYSELIDLYWFITYPLIKLCL